MSADQIRPNKETTVIKEDETVTLSCSYDTSSSAVRLYWYRQYLNGEPQYLMWKDARGVMSADQIRPNKETTVIKEDETVTLSCSYDTSSRYVTLYWYRQYPNGEPQYLMWKQARDWSSTGTPADRRFQATTSETSTELIITGVTVSDSALYYCALRVGAQ
ncbi:hypothetical protein Q8A67_008906 [Cirrhinus molitorella]|uniref:Ig-like domain-containing protein n=1 Tax=Cirrhinus molitorella TaxID=172907 RepID=A0AA88PY18_9TELE|nr:hypothetical protein Q8A67_008906 [Cirrhinus molitorella]